MSKDYKNNWVYTPKKITLTRGIGFGILDLMGGGWENIVSGVIFTFLLMNGVNAGITGAITGIGRVVDALFSLFIGQITDNFYTTKLGQKFGRRHFFILFGGILFALIFPLFWLHGTPWFYLIVYTAIEVIIAFILIPWETLPTEMTDDYKLRTVLSGSRMFISATGASLIFIILAILENIGSKNAYFITGIIWTVIFTVAIFISYGTTWERYLDAKQKKNNESSFDIKQNIIDYISTFKNKSFRKHLAIYLLSFTGKDLYNTLLPAFVIYAVGLKEGDSWTFLALAIVGIPVTIYASFLMIKRGPKFLFALSYLLIIVSVISYGIIYFLHIKNPFVIFVVISIFYQMGKVVLVFTPWNVFPFIPDVDRIMTKKYRTGVYAAVMTFFRKSTGGLATWVAGILLTMIHFNAGDYKINDAIHAELVTSLMKNQITIIFIAIPVVLILIALIISRTFNFNKETHTILVNEINRLDAGGKPESVTNEAKQVVEELTGKDYKKLYK